MSFTDQQKDLVQSTFEQVLPIADQAASMFYNRLFEIHPDYRQLFRGDMAEQGQMLMQMLSMAVVGLDDIESVQEVISDLGKRHVGYGVKKEDYTAVGSALLWTLEQGLGEAFTPEVRDAWVAVYTSLSDLATEAGYAA